MKLIDLVVIARQDGLEQHAQEVNYWFIDANITFSVYEQHLTVMI